MSGFTTDEVNDNLVTKAIAKTKIKELAIEKGYRGAFKVLYEGEVIGSPEDLPDMVDMELVTVSAKLDQAAKTVNKTSKKTVKKSK